MGWMTIRKATQQDAENLDNAARKFIRKYIPQVTEKELQDKDTDPTWLIEFHTERDDRQVWARERKLWRAQVQRTLGKGAEGIAYGYVGYHAK